MKILPVDQGASLIGEWEYIPVGISGDYMDLLTLKRVEKKDDIIVNIGGMKPRPPGVTDYHQYYFQIDPNSGASAIVAYNSEADKNSLWFRDSGDDIYQRIAAFPKGSGWNGNTSFVQQSESTLYLEFDDGYFVIPLQFQKSSGNEDDANRKIYGDRGITLNDELSGGNGNDRLFGLLGDDTLSGGRGNDRLMGGYEDDILRGEAGNDKLYGEFGDDKLYGGTGNDLIDGGQGADYMSGGAGNDTYYIDSSGDVIDDKGSASDEDTIILQNSVRFKLNRNIENATGSSGGDTLTGNGSSNELIGNGGSDTLIGAANSDTLIGGAGSDKLIGGSGADDITGGAGNDRLIGSGGSDTLNGGSGKDTYVLQRGSGFDVIEHFTNADQVTVKGFNDDRVSVVEKGGDALLYAKGDLLARVVDGAGMNII